MIPLKILIVGAAWQLGVLVLVMALFLWMAWSYLHQWAIPVSWPWVMGYALAIVVVAEIIYVGSKAIDDQVPIHLEVLLPAFVLGCMMKRPGGADPIATIGHDSASCVGGNAASQPGQDVSCVLLSPGSEL